MIELNFTGICKGCEYADLRLEADNNFADFRCSRIRRVKCIHENACLAMKEKTTKMLSQENENSELAIRERGSEWVKEGG